MEDYDKNGMLAKGEEVQYSDDPTPSRQTYSTEGIKRDPTMPFKVTHSLMDAMSSTTSATTYLQDSEATIYPTLVPETVIDEEDDVQQDNNNNNEEDD
uniref:Uncharacterized protein n=1 Tax=Panagrolaimus sp. ES5 TaxID=591445 RepID=A0AC34GDK2_9BILA